jgi:hypothetical protein
MSIQSKEAAEKRKQWGDKPCDHPSFAKEYYLGAQTGDKVCVQCGESFSPGEVTAIEKARQEPR